MNDTPKHQCAFCSGPHAEHDCPVVYTPIIDCEHKDEEDGCCHHPLNQTPECHIGSCPRLHRRICDCLDRHSMEHCKHTVVTQHYRAYSPDGGEYPQEGRAWYDFTHETFTPETLASRIAHMKAVHGETDEWRVLVRSESETILWPI